MVMVGGVLSAVIVGAILENGDLYASLAAESYLQSADDAEFWKDLNEEEKKKAEIMLSRIKQAKEGGVSVGDLSMAAETIEKQSTTITAAEASTILPKVEQPKRVATKASSDIFSDYE